MQVYFPTKAKDLWHNRVMIVDRDGVIAIPPATKYLERVEDLSLYPGVVNAIAELQHNGWQVAIASNQAGLATGEVSQKAHEQITQEIQNAIYEAGGRECLFLTCPHSKASKCICRKPKPAMLIYACGFYHADIELAVMVGDYYTDIEAGKAVGMKTVMVKTGRYVEVSGMLSEYYANLPDHIIESFSDIVLLML